MKCVLMNKNTEVLTAEYNEVSKFFDQVYEVHNIAYAPLAISRSAEEDLPLHLSTWFKGRGIPAWRDQLDLLLARLGITTPEELLDKAFGLSLSDQYWIKPFGSNVSHADINFFDHDFDAADFLDASFSDSGSLESNPASLRTPNNTTDGMLKKSWIIDGGTRYLLKGGYRGDVLQPFNEVLASWICERLGFSHAPYTLDAVKGKVVSKCACFIDKDTELIPAHQIMQGVELGTDVYEQYIRILEEAGISDAREQLENMFILDFLMLNEDRHMNNFGIIRDVNTLRWLRVAPIFDNGQSLNITFAEDSAAVDGNGRFFYEIMSFDQIISVVRSLGRVDLGALDGVADDFTVLLKQYQEVTHVSDAKVEALRGLVEARVKKLGEKAS